MGHSPEFFPNLGYRRKGDWSWFQRGRPGGRLTMEIVPFPDPFELRIQVFALPVDAKAENGCRHGGGGVLQL